LRDKFDDIFEHFPVLIGTTILPFKDKIVYDGFVKLFAIDFGKGIRSMMNEDYKIAKKNNKILTTL
jgi:hypothetical protein